MLSLRGTPSCVPIVAMVYTSSFTLLPLCLIMQVSQSVSRYFLLIYQCSINCLGILSLFLIIQIIFIMCFIYSIFRK
ncbi:hypothetical protein E2C01_096143 [Portunus trituberculatus]|uniref:Uncharacterized protein n=1 Tax=Portunus trituberculatus TaxID=210409 RepID=A0A5B7K7H7_PORTR|nr:hypothetical protein [Portunus trituberculatus]